MYIRTERDYQQALRYVEEMQNRGTPNLCCDERMKLIETIRAIELYQYTHDPVAMLALGGV
jgi:hypothetical protein